MSPPTPFPDFSEDIQPQYKTRQGRKGFVVKSLPIDDEGRCLYLWIYKKGPIVMAIVIDAPKLPPLIDRDLHRISMKVRSLISDASSTSFFMPLMVYDVATGLLRGEDALALLSQSPSLLQREVSASLAGLIGGRVGGRYHIFLNTEAKCVMIASFNGCVALALFSKFKNDMLTAYKILSSEAKKVTA